MNENILEKKVYYHDTDAGGVVYYGNYWKFLEEGRTALCLSRGVDVGTLFSKGVSFVVAHAEADYKSPARYGDTVRIITRVDKIGNTSMHFSQEIFRDGKLLVGAGIVWVCVGADFRPMAVPVEVRNAFEKIG